MAGVTGHCGAEVFAGRIVHVGYVALRGSRLRAERCKVRQCGREEHGRVAVEGIISGERRRNLMIGERALQPVGAATGGGQRVTNEGVCEVVCVYRGGAGNVGDFQLATASYQHYCHAAQFHRKITVDASGICADEGETGILVSLLACSFAFIIPVASQRSIAVACHAADAHAE